jgi:hypothetical protein
VDTNLDNNDDKGGLFRNEVLTLLNYEILLFCGRHSTSYPAFK